MLCQYCIFSTALHDAEIYLSSIPALAVEHLTNQNMIIIMLCIINVVIGCTLLVNEYVPVG